MAVPTNALAEMSLNTGSDWGNPNPDGKPTFYTVELEGFQANVEDIFVFFSNHPKLPRIDDAEIEDIRVDTKSKENFPTAQLVLRTRDAALRSLNFSHQLFDGQEIIVTIDGPSLDDSQQVVAEQAALETEHPAPVHVEQAPQPSVADEQPPPQQGGGGAYEPRRGGGGGGDSYSDQRDNFNNNDRGGGGNYGNNDRVGGGGYGGSNYGGGGRREEEGRQGGGGYGTGGGGGDRRYGDRDRRGGALDETLEMDADALAKAAAGRPRLNLKKRTPNATSSAQRPQAKRAVGSSRSSSIFGDAKPREEVLSKKGVDPNAPRPARPALTTSVRGGGKNNAESSVRGGGGNRQAAQVEQTAPPVVKNENVYDVLNTE